MTTQPAARTGRRLGLAAFAIILILATFALPLPGGASTFSSGVTVEHEGETVQDDLYVAAVNATISSDIEGDLSLAVVNGEVESTIGGSVHVVAGNITIRGRIEGTLYIAAGRVQLEGTVLGNTVVTGGRLEFGENARIDGDLLVFGAQAEIAGDVGGKLYGSVLHYDQDGAVSGNVELQADRISLGGDAEVGEDFRYQSQVGADVHADAIVGGEVIHTDRSPWNGIGPGALAPYGNLMRLVWSLVVGAVLIVIAPRLFYRAAEHAAGLLAAGIWGAFGLVIIPVLAVLALISVVFIPVGLFLLALLPIGLYLSQIVVSISIGRAILPRRWRDGSRGYLLFALTIGTMLIGTLRLAPVPFLNVVVVVIVSVWGFGALLMLLTDLTSARARTAMAQPYQG